MFQHEGRYGHCVFDASCSGKCPAAYKAEAVRKRWCTFGEQVQTVRRSGERWATHAASSVAEAADPESRDRGFQVSCTTCSFGANLFISYVRNGKTPEEIAKTATNVCITFNIESEIVCKGAVNAFVNDVFYVIKNNPNLTEKDVCSFLIGSSCEHADYEKKYNWTITLPSIPKPPLQHYTLPDEGSPIKRILHISDLHLDLYYQEGTNADCGLPLCCRETVGKPSSPSSKAGKWGDYRDCDSPIYMVDNMFENIAKNHKVDYIFWTGDLLPHDIYNQSKDGNIELIKKLTELITKHFPDAPIFPALGNLEGHPVNSFPQPEITEDEFSISWLYSELSKQWSNFLRTDISKTMIKGAYYSVPVEEGFRIISINMNYCNNKNVWLLLNNTDPADELHWLIKELQAAENRKERVYLIGHIPPGHNDCIKIWSRNFHRIVTRYESTIAAHFYGHTHFDELMLFYDHEEARPTTVAYIGSSTTPYSNVNPSYKIYTADGDRPESTRLVLDGETYFMNLTEANLFGVPRWKKLYSYKDAYNMPSLLPEDWDVLLRSMNQDGKLLDKYLRHMHRHSDSFPHCDAICRQEHLCRQITSRSQDYTLCHKFKILPEDHEISVGPILA